MNIFCFVISFFLRQTPYEHHETNCSRQNNVTEGKPVKKKFGLAGLVVLMVMLALGAAAEEGNTIIIGCDMYAPYTYKNGTGEFVGVDVDFATEAFGRLGYAVQFREIVWENKQSYLDSGEIDCLWSCFTMSGREDEYTWAGPYLYSRQVAMVRADSDYTELSQLAGKRAAVQASTTAEKALLRRENPNVPEMKQVLCFSTLGEAAAGAAQELRGHGGGARICRQQPGGYFAGSLSGDSADAVRQRAGRRF